MVKSIVLLLTLLPYLSLISASDTEKDVSIWMKYEHTFNSTKSYENPLYEVTKFMMAFFSPSGRVQNINGFWDGSGTWRVRFCPDELGEWSFQSTCSDTNNSGLHLQSGTFTCVPNKSNLEMYQQGGITRKKGSYNPLDFNYSGKWFDPVENKYSPADVKYNKNIIILNSPNNSDMVLVLYKN